MKIVVVGLGYVGLSNAVLLASKNEVIGVDIDRARVDAVTARISPIVDAELSQHLADPQLNLSASTDLKGSIKGADYIIISTPTNFDEHSACFDTSSVEIIISEITQHEPNACIVVKSTVPVGFIDGVRERLSTTQVLFSPEFLREGKALHDNLYPSRIIIGEKSERGKLFANLLAQCSMKPDVDILLTEPREAEAIKLFSNAYLAMRVAFFNEIDTFALSNSMSTRQIIDGVSLDPRVGSHYNNPSFGYGGYCLPKDTKQLLKNYGEIPENIISAIVDANVTRKHFLAQKIIRLKPNIVGVYRLSMKQGSDNYRQSAVLDIINIIKEANIKVIIYEPELMDQSQFGSPVYQNLEKFRKDSDLIIANRITDEIQASKQVIFTRDIYHDDI